MRRTLGRRKGRASMFVTVQNWNATDAERSSSKQKRGCKPLSVFFTSFLKSILDRHTTCFVSCSQTVFAETLVGRKEGIACGTRMHLEFGGSDAARFTIPPAC